MEENNTRIKKPKIGYWLNEVYGPAALLMILPLLGMLKWGGKFYFLSIVCLMIGFPILISGILRGRKTKLIFGTTDLQICVDKQQLVFTFDEIKAVRVADQTARKFLYIYSEDQTAYIPYKYFDSQEVLAELQQRLPNDAFDPTAHQKTEQFKNWREANWKAFTTLDQPLKVSCNRTERWLGIASLVLGIWLSWVSYSNSDFIGLICVTLLFIGSGLFLIFSSLFWVEATNQEITVRGLFRHSTIQWDTLKEVYVNTRQSVIVLVSNDSRIVLPKSSGWAGKDRDNLLGIINYKIELSGIEPKEGVNFKFWFSRSSGM